MQWFAIISAPRSGTHMLATALRTIPGVTVSGELFGFGISHFPSDAYRCWRESVIAAGEYQFAGSLIHREPVRDHYVAEWLLTIRLHSRFVCLHRENSLRRLLSIKVAEQTRRWGCIRRRLHRENPPPVTITPRELWDFHWQAEADRLAVNSLLPGYHEVTYERLVANWPAEMASLAAYLGIVLQEPPATRTKQQELRSLPESIKNFEEVAASVRACEMAGELTIPAGAA